MDELTVYKKLAGEAAAAEVASGMVVGLGHGSTAVWALRRIAQRLASGELEDILGVPCSRAVEEEARGLRIPLADISEVERVDLTIDGADELTPGLSLIKGGGGALLREKIVAQASAREIIVADHTKVSSSLGLRCSLPVEVASFGLAWHVRYIESLGAEVHLRRADGCAPFRTDQGNLILDCRFGPIADPAALSAALHAHAGVVEHGLFLGLASQALVAGPDGLTRLAPPLGHEPGGGYA